MRAKELLSKNTALKNRLETVLRDQRRLIAEVGDALLATSNK